MVKRSLVAILSIMLIMPNAAADPKPDIRLHITNNSQYVGKIDYTLLITYLRKLQLYWPIYKGDYYIEIGDDHRDMPKEYSGWHWYDSRGPIAYLDAKAFKEDNLDIYYGLTHELAEMAVNPFINKRDKKGKLVEICDNHQVMNFRGYVVASFDMPEDWNI